MERGGYPAPRQTGQDIAVRLAAVQLEFLDVDVGDVRGQMLKIRHY